MVLDQQKLVRIYEQHSPEIFRYAYRMLDDRDLSEECVADTFLRLIIAVRGGILPDNIRVYLYRIAYNWIVDHYRRRPPRDIPLEKYLRIDLEDDLPPLVAQVLERQRIRLALLQLPSEQRQVIELRFLENWSQRDIVEALGKTVEGTCMLQHRAVEALRQVLAEQSRSDSFTAEFENSENELDPRLKQMLNVYGVTPERDPDTTRYNQDRFVAILNVIFEWPAPSRAVMDWFTPSSWPPALSQLKQTVASSARRHMFLFASTALLVLALFGGMGITAYALSSSLPGDTLYPLKTSVENARAELTADPATLARLHIEFAARRLSEIRSLIHEGRYRDIAQAVSQFEIDIQKFTNLIEGLSQTDPTQAVGVSEETAVILLGYDVILAQTFADVPGDIQPVIQHAIHALRSAVTVLDAMDDDLNDLDEDADDATPSSQIGKTPQLQRLFQFSSWCGRAPSAEDAGVSGFCTRNASKRGDGYWF
jgi:RNA polymerase sigma-70 factor (ECF subfamily)